MTLTSDSDVKEYCITETEGISNCTWKTAQGNSATETITLSTEGEHKYYAYLKDEANNISTGNMYDTIIYDITNPILNTFYIKDTNAQKYTNNNKNTVYFTYNETNADKVCVTEGADNSSCNWQDASNNIEYTFANTNEEAKTIRGYVKDKAGNISTEVKTDSITYDKTAPTINKVEAPTRAYNSITVSVTADQDTSGVSEYCYATAQAGPYTCKSGNTNLYGSLQAEKEYTFWIYLKDKAGNGVQGNATQYKFKTRMALKDYLQTKGGSTFTLKSGMYRFIGTNNQVTHNYICFGTTDTKKCGKNASDENNQKYMYRIIGVTSSDDNTIGLKSNQLKLIKAIWYADQKWHNTHEKDIKWDDSDIKTYLNTTFLNDAVSKWDNGATWKGLITSQNWYNADQKPNEDGDFALTEEPKTSWTKKASQIGLMYATDYMNSNGLTRDSWLYFMNGWTTVPNTVYEWTMTRLGSVDGSAYYSAFIVIDTERVIGRYALDYELSIRPVFYVSPYIDLSGEGTKESPFIIHS